MKKNTESAKMMFCNDVFVDHTNHLSNRVYWLRVETHQDREKRYMRAMISRPSMVQPFSSEVLEKVQVTWQQLVLGFLLATGMEKRRVDKRYHRLNGRLCNFRGAARIYPRGTKL